MTQSAAPAGYGGRLKTEPLAGAGWPLAVVFIWAVYALSIGTDGFASALDRLSTDDAMRLAEVRDLLAGQGWYDLVQRRLNPPDGVLMHWSRVVDLPIAALLLGFRSVAPENLAVALTITVWPLLLLLPALLAAAAAGRSLAGPWGGAIAAFMMALSPGVTTRFSPGAIDHHGAQIALALILLAAALRLDRSRAMAAVAGLAAALMMAIGMETAPHVAACAAVIALRWALAGDDPGVARGVATFGLTFSGAMLIVAVATLPPDVWMGPVCDALGIGHLVVAGVGGVGLAFAARYAEAGPASRLSALALIGVAVVAGLGIAAPGCLASPYAALPEALKTRWLADVREARSIVTLARDDMGSAIVMGLPLLGLVAVAVWAVVTAPRERFWPVATAAVMCASACAVTAWQIRGLSLAFALGGPILPLAAVAVGARGGRIAKGLAVLAFSPAALCFAGLGLAGLLGVAPAAAAPGSRLCPAADYLRLAAVAQRGLALNTIDVGPFVIAHTGLSAVAAPYHRNVDGLLASLDAFEGSEETARAIAVSRRADLVVVCPSDGGLGPSADEFPGGFSDRLLSGPAPAWLAPVDLGPDTRLKVWRVLAGR